MFIKINNCYFRKWFIIIVEYIVNLRGLINKGLKILYLKWDNYFEFIIYCALVSLLRVKFFFNFVFREKDYKFLSFWKLNFY